MANQQLIQMAKDVGASQGFNDVGGAFEQSFSKWYGQAQAVVDERKKTKEAADARVADYMERIPGGNLAKIPEYAKETVSNFLREGRNQYAEHANALRDLDPKDKEYQDHVNSMNKITQSFVTLDNQFTRLLEDKMDFMESVEFNTVSYGNKPEDIDFLSNAYTDAADMIFTPEGNILFEREGKQLALDELPKWVEVNSTVPAALAQLNAQYYKNGEEITGPLEQNLRVQIDTLVRSQGRHGVISLAADSPFSEDGRGLGVPDEILHDPEKLEDLTKMVVDNWVNAIKDSAKIGREQADAKWKRTRTPKTPPAPKYSLDKFLLDD